MFGAATIKLFVNAASSANSIRYPAIVRPFKLAGACQAKLTACTPPDVATKFSGALVATKLEMTSELAFATE